MKILLLNDNPVVTKLVTLSAQKTSDELEIASSLEEIKLKSYELLVVDDTLYSDEMFKELKAKIQFSCSLYICARDAEEVSEFSNILKKPFLPTDLVELFVDLGNEVGPVDTDMNMGDLGSEEDFEGIEELESLDELSEPDDIEELNDISLDEDEDILLDDIDTSSDSVLDDEEAQKVKDLLDETSLDEDIDLDDELDFNLDDELSLEDDLDLGDEEESEEELSLDDDLGLDEELDLGESDDELSLEDDLDLGDEEESEEELSLDDDLGLDEELDLESQIENAVEELSEEELESELDEETLIDIVSGNMDSLDSLNSRDLKIAMGEEVEDEAEEEIVSTSIQSKDEENTSRKDDENIEETKSDVDGVEALKNLLAALSDKNVAASMKGMKISINITLGDQ